MLSLGPARMDVFVRLPEDEIEEACSIDRKRCMIELGFGEKIPVTGIDFAVGGNTGNNAVGLVRLGHKTAMAGSMGDGWSDKQALQMLSDEGVDTHLMTTDKGKVGFGVVIDYSGERTILSYYPETQCVFPKEEGLLAKWIYLTTAGENYEDFYREAVNWAEASGAKIAFNPGSRQIKSGLSRIKFVAERTEVLFVNKEEAESLLDRPMDSPVKELLDGLRGTGAKLVVITDGMEGAYAFDGQKYLHMPVVPVQVIERTGAGDAFGSGFLAAVMHGKGMGEALRWGTCNSAAKLGFIGPQRGLLNRQQMEEWLARSSDILPREI